MFVTLTAAIGLEALAKIKTDGKISQEWATEKMNRLKEFRKPYGETGLAILPEIESLVTQQPVPLPPSYPMF